MIIATPDKYKIVDLPGLVSLQGVDLLKRPVSDGKESFTQVGVLGTIQNPGTLDFEVNPNTGNDGYGQTNVGFPYTYSIHEQPFNLAGEDHIGVSFWYKTPETYDHNDQFDIVRIGLSDRSAINVYLNPSWDRIGVDIETMNPSFQQKRKATPILTEKGQWHHYMIYTTDVRTTSQVRIYRNGVLYEDPAWLNQSQALVNGLDGANEWFLMGYSDTNGRTFQGFISDVYVSKNPNFKDFINDFFNNNIPSLSDTAPLTIIPKNSGDIPASKWFGGATPEDCLIGKGFVGNGVDKYIEADYSRPGSTYFGVAFWYFHETGAENEALVTFFNSASSNDATESFSVYMRNNNEIWARASRSSGSPLEFYISSSNTPTYGIKENQWNHVAIWINASQTGNDEKQIIINGRTDTIYTSTYTAPTFTQVRASDKIVIGNAPRKNHLFPELQLSSGKICDLHWSADPSFKDRIADYADLPPILCGLLDVSPTRYISTEEAEVTIPNVAQDGDQLKIVRHDGDELINFFVIETLVEASEIRNSEGEIITESKKNRVITVVGSGFDETTKILIDQVALNTKLNSETQVSARIQGVLNGDYTLRVETQGEQSDGIPFKIQGGGSTSSAGLGVVSGNMGGALTSAMGMNTNESAPEAPGTSENSYLGDFSDLLGGN